MDSAINVLEDKLSKSEASATKSFKDKNDDLITLKTVLKNRNQEIDSLKKEINLKGKVIKEKEKEIYRLDQKSENLGDSVKQLKCEVKDLKSVNKKLVKGRANKSTCMH